MKKILAMVGLAAALSGCVVIVDPGTTPVTFTSASAKSTNGYQYAESGTNIDYTCPDRSIQLEVKFSWTGDLKEYAIEFYGQNNPTPPSSAPYPRYPTSGFFQVAGRIGVTGTTAIEVLNYTVDQIHPVDSDLLRTQAVIVTPKPNTAPLGATLIRIVGRDTAGNSVTFNVPGKIVVYGNGNCPN